MIRRIHIQRYKSLRNVEVALKPLSVLFGPNAAGKSNFIDALQLLSRMAASKEAPALVGFEEPENGVHPRRIRDIAKILESRAESGNTQLIVTTHSPILPDHIANESLFVFHKKSTGTIIEPFSVWGPLARRSGIDDALEEEAEPVPVSQRMLRGDFDA
jgi:AAA15 family ATPase/GTPase